MISSNDAQMLIDGGTVTGSDGEKIGKVGQVYLDDTTGEPTWVTVKTGMFGTSESFVPLDDATMTGDGVTVPYGKDMIKDAPRVDADAELTPGEESELYSYYGLSGMTGTTAMTDTTSGMSDTDLDAPIATAPAAEYTTGRRMDDADGTVGYDTSGPTTDSAMTRSEEQLRVGTETVETGRARLRKYVVTEQQTVSVPVTHEEVRIVREPITDATVGDALAGPDISEEEHEVTLHAERAVVDKDVVPVERVRLDVDEVTDTERVTEDVRKEVIETDGLTDTTSDSRADDDLDVDLTATQDRTTL